MIIKRVFRRISRLVDKLAFKLELNSLAKQLLNPKSGKRIILFQTPSHTNIGDHAIAEAEILFLQSRFSDYRIIEVNQAYHFPLLALIKGKLPTTDVIMLHGGGNFGNEYMHEENIRRSVVESFPNHKIVVFPQTIFYTNDKSGGSELQISQRIFEKHSNLTLIAREKVSLDLMKNYFPKNTVLFMPDIVLSMDKTDPIMKREGILMVLRDDEERVLSDAKHKELDDLVRKYSDSILYSDMHYHKWVRTTKERDILLDYKFIQFKSSKLVVTDRLHGMVFAAITQTPCIAFSNYNQKVSGTYEWIKELNYIKYINWEDDLEANIQELLSLPEVDVFDASIFRPYFDKLIYAINN